ncbi:MAG: endonuclease domain-containing protein [Saprospiraceae bacterium]
MLHQNAGNKELYLRIRALAREMRKKSTKAEDYFWEKVRNRKLFGLKWNRQFIIQCPIDPFFTKYYISDFHCHRLRLIVELDGQIHLKQQEEDLIRTERMNQWGYTVIRFSNEEVLEHWDEVEEKLKEYLNPEYPLE